MTDNGELLPDTPPRRDDDMQNPDWWARAFFYGAPVGMFLCTKPGRFIQTNGAFERMLGWTADELKSMTFWDITHADDLSQNRELVERTHRGTLNVFHITKRYRRKDGNYIWVDITSQPIRNKAGEVVYGSAVVQDVSDRVHAEDVLQESQRTLWLAQRLESVGRLAGGVAHDFNNLLMTINGRSEILLGRLGADDPSRKQVERILKAGEAAAFLTKQLLAYGRKQVLQPKVLDLNELVRDLGDVLRKSIKEDIELVIQTLPGQALVKADPMQIQQVLINLSSNARDAMPNGGLINIAIGDVTIDAPLSGEREKMELGRYIVLSVADSGIGMDADTKAKVFDPFFTTKELGQGTGLGLATTYGVVKQSGGYIWVVSDLGKGTRFEVYLPRVGGDVEMDKADSKMEEAPAGGETILVVDDEAEVRAIVAEILKSRGYDVLVAGLPSEALAIVDGHAGELHLLLTDVVMPEMNGRKLAERVKEKRPGTRVILMSGYARESLGQEPGLALADAFLMKPLSSRKLLDEVRAVLDRGAVTPAS